MWKNIAIYGHLIKLYVVVILSHEFIEISAFLAFFCSKYKVFHSCLVGNTLVQEQKVPLKGPGFHPTIRYIVTQMTTLNGGPLSLDSILETEESQGC